MLIGKPIPLFWLPGKKTTSIHIFQCHWNSQHSTPSPLNIASPPRNPHNTIYPKDLRKPSLLIPHQTFDSSLSLSLSLPFLVHLTLDPKFMFMYCSDQTDSLLWLTNPSSSLCSAINSTLGCHLKTPHGQDSDLCKTSKNV